MEIYFNNTAPVSAFAAAGACLVKPEARVRASANPAGVGAPALTAWLPQAHQVQIAQLTILAARSYMGPETKPSNKLVGVRGVPPRGRPV